MSTEAPLGPSGKRQSKKRGTGGSERTAIGKKAGFEVRSGSGTAKREGRGKTSDREGILHVHIKDTIIKKAGRQPLSPTAQIKHIRAGIPAKEAVNLSDSLGLTKSLTFEFLGFPRSSVERSLSTDKPLTPDRGERVLATSQLVDLVARMVKESGDPEGFDAGEWLGSWLSKPHPALGGVHPGSYLDTHMGIDLVRDLLLRAQSGAYS